VSFRQGSKGHTLFHDALVQLVDVGGLYEFTAIFFQRSKPVPDAGKYAEHERIRSA